VKAEVTHDLQRFLDAQASVYEQARSELAAGQKRSHWMWLIFPQIRGLGSSPTAQRFAISGLDEAIAYLNYPVLGARLRECTALVNGLQGRSLGEVFGYPDDLKFHSSITLFAASVDKGSPNDDDRVFRDALSKYFEGRPDQATLDLL
jgi:uncharacterized protein (DUF1810 family)